MKLNGEARSLNGSVCTRDKPNGGPPPDGIGKAGNFTAQFRGRSRLTAAAPSTFLPDAYVRPAFSIAAARGNPILPVVTTELSRTELSFRRGFWWAPGLVHWPPVNAGSPRDGFRARPRRQLESLAAEIYREYHGEISRVRLG